ncbi:hypothetical protein [Beijerinckia sp. L45]|uniref:hypothetical protein n=1 Tax=Beijerinckia sp. L45 TaxID=1641855 RepID=UPI00131CA87B|nr:hypothetical protein [Beijerinckia sp. L45]
MRRPVKPFVTEYKGPIRRPGQAAGSAQRLQSEEFSYATAANEVFSRSGGDMPRHNPEDAYEAALRAADALFSPAEKAPEPKLSAPRFESTAMADHDQPDIESGDAPGSGGRILRAIDETPAPGLAELEAEREPKRRGRKPGSKNKPKAPVFIDDVPRAPVQARPAPSTPPPVFRDADFDAPRPAPEATPRPATTTPSSTYRSRDEERFAWVRTKLKPGEEWKRRLPKVCW